MSFDASKFSERYAKRKQELEEERRKREEEEEKAMKAEEEKRRLTENARTAGTAGLSSAEETMTAPVDLTSTIYRTPDISAGDTDVSLKPEVNPIQDFANFSKNLWGGALDAIHRVDDTVSNKFVQAGAQTMNTLKMSSLPVVGINAPENRFSEEQTEKLIDYMNGKRDLNTNFNFNRFKNSDVAKNIPQVAIIADQLERGVYQGTAQDIKKTYDAGLQTRYNQWYENVVAPTDYKSQQQDAANIRDLGQIGGGALNWIAGTAEKAAEYIGMSMATGNPITGAVLTAASSDRSQQAQQIRSFDLTLDQAAKDMGFDVGLSVVFSKMLGGTFDFFQKSLGNAIPKKLVLNRAAQLIKNALAAVGASYATQGTTGEIRNIYNLFQGRNVTPEQWAEPWWSLDTLKAVLITSALYTATNTAKDFRSIKNIKGLTDKYGDLNSSLSGLKKNFGMQIYNEDLPKAVSTYNQGVSYIDTFFKNNNLGQYTEAMRKAYQKMWLDQTIGAPYADANIDLSLGSGGQAPTGGAPIVQTPTSGAPATQTQQPTTVLPPKFPTSQVPTPSFDPTQIVKPVVANGNNGNPEQPSAGDSNQLPTGGKQAPTNSNAEFYTSDGKEIVKFKSGQHTKTNYTDGENVYKSPTVGGRETNEAKVYEILKDKEGIADGSKVMVTDENNDEYAMIRTPKFNHVLSTDDVAADKRGSVAQHTDLLNGKHVDELLKGINAITDAKISYNDPLQVGYKDGNAYIFDFSNSMIENYGDDWNKYLRENYFTLTRFLNEFGAKEFARQIESSITLLDRLQLSDPNSKWATTANLNEHELDIFKELENDLYKNGIKFKNVYTVANARGIPMREGDNEVRKTETRVTEWGPFLVFSEKPLSDKFINDWELSPIYENRFEQVNAEKPAVEKPTETTQDSFEKLEKKYGTKQKFNDGNGDVEYIKIDKSGPKSPFKDYFKYDNPETTNDGAEDATMTVEELNKKPVVALIRAAGGKTEGYIFKNEADLEQFLDPTKRYGILVVARNAEPGSSYALEKENGQYVWRSEYTGKKVPSQTPQPSIVGDAVSAFKKTPSVVRHIDFRGKTFKNADEFANIMQKAASPVGETDYWVFTKDTPNGEEIIAQDTHSKNLFGSTNSMNNSTIGVDYLTHMAEALGADHVYNVHNHPDHSTPSGLRKDFTGKIKTSTARGPNDYNHNTWINQNVVPKLKSTNFGGNLVVGTYNYSFFGGETKVRRKGFKRVVDQPYSNGYKFDGWADVEWRKKSVYDPKDVIEVAKNLPSQKGYSKVVFVDADAKPRAIINVKDDALKGYYDEVNTTLYDLSLDYGGAYEVGVVTNNKDVYKNITNKKIPIKVTYAIDADPSVPEGNWRTATKSGRASSIADGPGTPKRVVNFTPKDEQVDNEDFIGRNKKVDEAKPQKWNGKANKPSTTQASLKPTEKSTGDNGVQKAWTTIENPRLSITAEINREIEEGRLKRKEGLGTMSRIDLENLERKMTKGMLGVGHNRMFRKAYGFFEVGNKRRPGSKWIWLAQASDFETFFHEFGHFVNDKWFKSVFKDHPAVEQELIDLAEARWEGVYKGETRLKEGLAEAIKFFLAYPDFLYKHYPNISNVILYEFMEEPYLKKMFPKLQKMAEQWINMTPVERVLANVNKGARGKIEVNIDNALKRASRWTVQKWFNDLEPIWYYTLKANKKLGINRQKLDYHPENDIFHAIQNAGSQETINSFLKDGMVDDGIQITQGFNKIISNLRATKEEAKLRGVSVTEATMDNIDLLYAAMVSYRALEYVERGKEPGISITNAEYTIQEAQKNPRVMEALKTIWDDANSLIMWTAAKGYIKYDTAKTIIENNKHYTGMNRRIENAGVGTRVRVGNSGRNPLKGIQGSDKVIENPLMNTIVNEAMLIKAVQENSALQQMDKLWDKAGGMGEFYTRTSPEMIFKGTVTLENFKKELDSQLAPFGVSADDLDLTASYDMFGMGTENIPRMVMSYMKGGVRKFIKFADNDYGKSLYRALQLSKGRDMPDILEWINKLFVTPVQLGATALNPRFAITNLPSDNAQRFLSSNRWTVPYLSIVSDVLRVLPLKSKLAGKILEKVSPETMNKLNNDFKEYLRSGAPISGRYVGELKTVKNSLGEITGLTKKELFGDVVIEDFSSFCEALDRVKEHTWDKLADKLQFLSEVSEFATRFGEFVATRNKLLKKGFDRETAIKAAGIQAKEVTQNFATKGEWSRYANKDVPFFSATLGGIYKAGQDLLKNPTRYIARLAMLATAIVGIKGLSDLLGGEEAKEYRKGVNKQKAYDNFLIYAGDGEFYAIKKPQGPARAVINLAELLYDKASGNIEEGEEGEALAEWAGMAAEDNLPVSKITDALPGWSSSLLENLINKDLFYGTELVTKDLKDLDPKDQYNKYTSEVAKLIGGVLNIAPIYVDNVMKDAFAGVGEATLDAIDYVVNTAQGKPTEDLKISLMNKVDANTNSEYVDKIYELQEKYSRDANNGRLSEANADRLEELDIGVSTLKQVTKMQKAVKADTSLTKEQREKRVDELDALRTDVARYYLGKEPIVKGNKQIIEKMEFYPSKEEYEYEPYRGADKVTISFADPKVKDRYSELAQEHYKDELNENYDYDEASEAEKRKMRSKARAAAKTKALNDMKEELYYEQY